MSQEYLRKIKPGAIRGWETNKILPSVTGAQAIIESGWGSSRLAKPPYNNNFGIKASPDWTGRTVTMQTREYIGGRNVTVNASFRAYDSLADSIADHAMFFTSTEWRKNNYRAIIGETDYKKACRALQAAGYATDPQYANTLIRVIEQNNLQSWDEEVLSGRSQRSDTPTRSNQASSTSAFSQGVKRVGGQMSKEAVQTLKRTALTIIGDAHAHALVVGTEPKAKSLNFYYSSDMTMTNLASWITASTTKEILIVAVGTYGVTTQAQIDTILRAAGNKPVILVDTGAEVDQAYSVSALYQANSASKNNVFWCDWYQYSEPLRNQYYSKDSQGKRTILSAEGRGDIVPYVIQGIHEAITGDFSSRKAENSKEKLLNVSSIRLEPDGMMYFPAYDSNGKQVEGSEQTAFRGLYSPYGDEYIYNSVAQQQFGIPTAEGNSIWIDAEFKDTSILEGYRLMEEGAKALLELAQPSAQYTVDLAETPPGVSVGDTGLFIDHEFDPPLYIQARILSITTSRTNPGKNRAVIGNVVELYPKPKQTVKRLQADLARSYEAMKEELVEQKPTTIILETSNGTLITDSGQTTVMATVLQENINITDRFSFKWSRSSGNLEKDQEFNQQLDESYQSSVLTIYKSDLGAKECKFTVTIYDSKGNLINSEDISLKEARSGKSAYELAQDKGFTGSLEDWLKSLEGRDGNDGVPGEKGEDGNTSYTHIAYANSPTGKDFTTAKQTGQEFSYIGQYVDLIKQDSQDWRKYSWAYIKGKKGEEGQDGRPGRDGEDGAPGKPGRDGQDGRPGKDGQDGKDGKSAYLYYAYADKDSAGKLINFSLTDDNRDWKGYYSSNNPVQSKNPADYTWEESPKNIKKDISQRALSEDLNKVISEQTSLAVALNSKMDSDAYKKQQAEYQRFMETVQTDSKNAQFLAKQIEQANVKISKDLQEQALRLLTLQGHIQVDGATNSISISNKSSNTQVILDDQGLKFVDGGVVVGKISQQYLEIMRGIFAKSIQVGRHKIEPLADDPRHLLITYLGGDK